LERLCWEQQLASVTRKKARNERSPPRDSSPEVIDFALRPFRIQGAKSAELPQG